MFFRAQTTARTQKRHVSVLKSKYPRYSASTGTTTDVSAAAIIAMTITAFFLTKDTISILRRICRMPSLRGIYLTKALFIYCPLLHVFLNSKTIQLYNLGTAFVNVYFHSLFYKIKPVFIYISPSPPTTVSRG